MDWYEATKKCAEMGGRLPTRIELIDLIDNHAKEIEDWKDDIYWSATTLSDATQFAWRTYLNNGYTNYAAKTNTNDSRCVRSL